MGKMKGPFKERVCIPTLSLEQRVLNPGFFRGRGVESAARGGRVGDV